MYETVKLNTKNGSDDLARGIILTILKHMAAGAGGFFASCATFEGFAPFGIALCSAVMPEFIPACVLGCAAGYFYVYGVTVLTLRYIAAAAVAGIFAYLLKRSFKTKFYRYFSAVAGFFSVFSTGLVLSMSITLSADEIVIYGAEGAAAAVGAWFLDRFVHISPVKKTASQLSGSEVTAVLTVFGIMLLALSGFPVSFFSLSVIFGAYAVMVTATFGGDKYGSLAGICAGVVLGFSQSAAFVTGGIALAGLLTGIFGKKNRFISAVIFILSVALTAFAARDVTGAAYIIYDVGIAAFLFIATPKKLRKFYSHVFTLSDNGTYLSGQRKMMKTQLKIASEGMNEVASAVKAVGGIYRRRTMPKRETVCANVCNRVCRDCDKNDSCWNKNRDNTSACFENIYESLKQNQGADSGLPEGFTEKCMHPDKVLSCMSAGIEKYRIALREAAKTGETVNIVSDQFCSISDVFCDLSDGMDDGDEYDASMSDMVTAFVHNEMELPTLSCAAFRTVNGNFYFRMGFPENTKIDENKICDNISRLVDMKLEKPVVQRLEDGSSVLTVCNRTKYRVESGARQISSGGGQWCGDTFDSFYDGKGKYYMILSDGMGTGKKAAADSVLCCSLCSSLLRSGFSPDVILKMINSAMLVRSGEESLATLDIAVIDLYDGNVIFYKAGASFSVAMKRLKMLKIEKPSLPVGILREIEFEKISLELRDGDVFVLMSDGVTGKAVSVWRDILKSSPDYDGDELADKLAKTAHMNSYEDSPDDITVMTATVLIND